MTQYDYATDPTGARAGDGGSTADQVKDQVKEKAQVAQDKARAATGQARSRLRDQVDQRSTQAGQRATGTAQDVRSIAEELRRQGKDTPARLAERAADRAEHVGRYLQSADADRLLADVEDFARKRPWAVVAGGLALGFAASRLLKASSSQRYRSSQHGGRGRSWFDDADYDRGGTGYDQRGTGYDQAGYAGETYIGAASTAGTAPVTDPAYTGTASTTDPAYTGSDYATTRAYPEPVSEPLGAEAPPVVGTYDPEPTTTTRAPADAYVPDPEPTTTTRAPADAYDVPDPDPVDTRRRPSPDPLT